MWDQLFWLDVASLALSNQITGSFDQQFHWKESLTIILDFLHWYDHHRNVASAIATFVWTGVVLVQSDC